MERWEYFVSCAPGYWKTMIFEPSNMLRKLISSDNSEDRALADTICRTYLPDGSYYLGAAIPDSMGVWRLLYAENTGK